jgi:hypothetical protein
MATPMPYAFMSPSATIASWSATKGAIGVIRRATGHFAAADEDFVDAVLIR